jgi:hypothetical protein
MLGYSREELANLTWQTPRIRKIWPSMSPSSTGCWRALLKATSLEKRFIRKD